MSFDHTGPYDIIKTFDYNYVKSYFDGSNVYCTLDSLIGIKYRVAIYNGYEYDDEQGITQTEFMKDSRLYKTIIKGFKLKYDTDFESSHVKHSSIDLCRLHNDEKIQLSLNKSIIVRKLCNILNNIEIIPVIQTYYKSKLVVSNIQNVNNIPKLKICNTGEYNFGGHDLGSQDISKISGIKLSEALDNIKYYSFWIDEEEFKTITLNISWCNFKSKTYDGDNCLVLTKFNSSTWDVLVKLHNKVCDYLPKLCSKYIKIVKTFPFFFCDTNNSLKKLDDDPSLKLSVKFNKKSKTYDEKIKFIKSLKPNTKIKIQCTGRLWSTHSGCGIKFYAHTIEKY